MVRYNITIPNKTKLNRRKYTTVVGRCQGGGVMKIKATNKGIALLAFIENGLAKKKDNGFEADKFEDFWRDFIRLLKESGKEGKYIGEMLDDDSYYARENRNKYLKYFVIAFIGTISGGFVSLLFKFIVELL